MKRMILIAIVVGAVGMLAASEAAAQHYSHHGSGVRVNVNLGGHGSHYCPHSYRPSYSHYYRPSYSYRPTYSHPPVVVHPRPYSHPPVYGSRYYPSPGVQIAGGILGIVNGAINAHNSHQGHSSHSRPSHGSSHGRPSYGSGHGSGGGSGHGSGSGGGHGAHRR